MKGIVYESGVTNKNQPVATLMTDIKRADLQKQKAHHGENSRVLHFFDISDYRDSNEGRQSNTSLLNKATHDFIVE